MQGKIISIGLKYVIEGVRQYIKPTPILNSLLPGDIVEYESNPITNKLQIKRLVSRVPFKTVGIVQQNKLICYPLLPQTFTLTPDLTNFDLTKPTCVVLIDIQGPQIISQWDELSSTRKNDWKIILDMYKPIDSLVPDIKDEQLDIKSLYQDLTHLDTFNIDPVVSKDFDDAISIDISDSKIYIHIVDAHNQIIQGSEEDNQAFSKSFTLYLSEHINNILPDNLANDKLSLIISEPRKTVTIEYSLDPNTLEIDDDKTKIYLGIITIKTRYDYEKFDNKIKLNPNDWLEKFLHTYKLKFNPINLDTPSLKLEINQETGSIESYQIKLSELETSPSHQLITWMMIHTNITVSKLIDKNSIPQRYHSKAIYNTCDSNLVFDELTSSPYINAILGIKKFRKAIYSSTELGHDGLKLQSYTHFTSPIRRYFDVIIHRIIGGITYYNLPEILEYINLREIHIDSLVKLYSRLKILDYLDKNKQRNWIGYWIPQGLILEDFLFEIKYYPIDITKLYTQVKIKIVKIDWSRLEPEVSF